MEILTRLRAGLEQMLSFLPALGAALLILLVGFLVARGLERLVDGFLYRIHFDRSAARWGVTEAVERTGTHLDPARLVGKLLFWFVMLAVILLATTALGLENIGDVFGELVSYVPRLVAAIVVIVLGLILGEFVRGLILASAGAVPGVPTLAKAAKAAVTAISIFMALQQLGVGEEIVTTTFTLILGACALAIALAFGIGNMHLAGELTRRWFEAGRGGTGTGSSDSGAAPPSPPSPSPPVPPAPGGPSSVDSSP